MRADPISPRNDFKHFGAIDAKLITDESIKKNLIMAIYGPRINNNSLLYDYETEKNKFNGIENQANYNWIQVDASFFT